LCKESKNLNIYRPMNNIMVKIDLKDRKILYELDLDSRQSFSKIGKKVGIHKNVVAYRINRLIKKGVIKHFYTVIDSFRLGYNCFRIYIVLRHSNPAIKKEIIDYFVNNKYTWWVGSFEGNYDLAVVIWVKELYDFHIFWDKTLEKYRHYFLKQVFCNYVQLQLFRHSFILDKYKRSDREKWQIRGGRKKVETDELDFRILKLLAINARIQTREIAKKLQITINTANNKINKLMKLDIIQGFRVDIDYSKLGYQFFKVNIDLNNYTERKKIISYIKYNPHLEMIDKSIGYYDLELDFWVEDLNQFHEIMDNLTTKFPESIKNYIYVHDSKKYKMLYIPEE